MATQPRGRGFWRGFLTGLVVTALGLVALAIAFPLLRAPEVPEGSLQAPAGPVEPQGMAGSAPGGLLPAPAPAPLVPGLPDATTPAADAPPAGAGSPSLAGQGD
jgi:hypothetical protein